MIERGDTRDERGRRGRGTTKGQGSALVLHGNYNDSNILSQGIASAAPTEGHDHSGAQDVYHEWHNGQKKGHVCALIRPPYTCAQCNYERFFWCTHCGGCAFCLTTTDYPARGGVARDTDRWVHLFAHQGAYYAPHCGAWQWQQHSDGGANPFPGQKQRKVCSWADTSMPTTTSTTRSGRLNRPPPPTDGGYLSRGDSTLEKRCTKNDTTPQRRLEGTGAHASKLGCMTATFAYPEVVWCMGEVLEPRAWSKALDWCDNLKQCVDMCDHSMSPKPHWWQRLVFFF